MPGSDEAVQPSAAGGDVPPRVRHPVRWQKVKSGKLIAGHVSLAVPIGEIAASAPDGKTRCCVGALVRKMRREGLKRLIPRPKIVWSRTPGTYKIWHPGAAEHSVRTAAS